MKPDGNTVGPAVEVDDSELSSSSLSSFVIEEFESVKEAEVEIRFNGGGGANKRALLRNAEKRAQAVVVDFETDDDDATVPDNDFSVDDPFVVDDICYYYEGPIGYGLGMIGGNNRAGVGLVSVTSARTGQPDQRGGTGEHAGPGSSPRKIDIDRQQLVSGQNARAIIQLVTQGGSKVSASGRVAAGGGGRDQRRARLPGLSVKEEQKRFSGQRHNSNNSSKVNNHGHRKKQKQKKQARRARGSRAAADESDESTISYSDDEVFIRPLSRPAPAPKRPLAPMEPTKVTRVSLSCTDNRTGFVVTPLQTPLEHTHKRRILSRASAARAAAVNTAMLRDESADQVPSYCHVPIPVKQREEYKKRMASAAKLHKQYDPLVDKYNPDLEDIFDGDGEAANGHASGGEANRADLKGDSGGGGLASNSAATADAAAAAAVGGGGGGGDVDADGGAAPSSASTGVTGRPAEQPQSIEANGASRPVEEWPSDKDLLTIHNAFHRNTGPYKGCGTLQLAPLKRVLSMMNLSEENTFVDLGSGPGNVLYWAAGQFRVREALGYERESYIVEFGADMRRRYVKKHPVLKSRIKLYEQELCDLESLPARVDRIYAYDRIMRKRTLSHIAQLINNLSHPVVFVSFKHPKLWAEIGLNATHARSLPGCGTTGGQSFTAYFFNVNFGSDRKLDDGEVPLSNYWTASDGSGSDGVGGGGSGGDDDDDDDDGEEEEQKES